MGDIFLIIILILLVFSLASGQIYEYILQCKDRRKNAHSHNGWRTPTSGASHTLSSTASTNSSVELGHPSIIRRELVVGAEHVEQSIEEMEFHRILIDKRDKLQTEIVELEYRLRLLKDEIQKNVRQSIEIEKYDLPADMPIEAVVKTLASQDGILEHKHFYETYEDYLKSDLWKAKRAVVLVRDNDICQLCGGRATQVHHQRYPQNLGSEPISWMIAICDSCHSEAHGKPARV